jgi:cobalamin biosynthesis protein CobD/CbiB
MVFTPDALWILVGALVLDALIGDPGALWRRLPHPVAAIGTVIGWRVEWWAAVQMVPRFGLVPGWCP